MAPTSTPTDPILIALAPFASILRPESPAQLAKVWRDDFSNLSQGVVNDLVRQRLGSGEYDHFRLPSASASPQERQAASLKSVVQASRPGRNPLSGM
jgi:hypothetical protein